MGSIRQVPPNAERGKPAMAQEDARIVQVYGKGHKRARDIAGAT